MDQSPQGFWLGPKGPPDIVQDCRLEKAREVGYFSSNQYLMKGYEISIFILFKHCHRKPRIHTWIRNCQQSRKQPTEQNYHYHHISLYHYIYHFITICQLGSSPLSACILVTNNYWQLEQIRADGSDGANVRINGNTCTITSNPFIIFLSHHI